MFTGSLEKVDDGRGNSESKLIMSLEAGKRIFSLSKDGTWYVFFQGRQITPIRRGNSWA